jgi:hypothetical protein
MIDMYRSLALLAYTFIFSLLPVIFVSAFTQAQSYTPPQLITVEMYRLDRETGANLGIPCTKGNRSYGCTAVPENVNYVYPFNSGTITIGIEDHQFNGVQQGYLHNVVP